MLRAIDFHGLKGVEFSKGEYTALLIPEMGANLVRLCHTGLGAEILRTPAADEIETFRRRPQVFGMPLLFPPNRIADGRYEFDGRTYRFPITIEKEHNYHHGILKSQPFAVSKAWETDEETLVASIVAVCWGMDSFNLSKILSVVLIFGGVYLVTMSRSRADVERTAAAGGGAKEA